MLKKGLCLLIGIMMLFCQINVVHATNLASGAESAVNKFYIIKMKRKDYILHLRQKL